MQRVYVLEGIEKCKIGIGAFPDIRRGSIQSNSFENYKLVYNTDYIDNARIVERVVHRLLKEFRIKGEWFKISSDIAISTIKKALIIISKGEEKQVFAPGRFKSRFNFTISENEQTLLLKISAYLSIEQNKKLSLGETVRIIIRQKAEELKIQ